MSLFVMAGQGLAGVVCDNVGQKCRVEQALWWVDEIGDARETFCDDDVVFGGFEDLAATP
jgi:hypothetical protein